MTQILTQNRKFRSGRGSTKGKYTLEYPYVYTLYVNIEFYNKKTGGISVGTVITALVHIGLNIVLIRLFGYQAAAYTMLIAELLLGIHMFIVKQQGMLGVFQNRQNIAILAVSGALCMAVLLLYSNAVLRYAVVGLILAVLTVLFLKNKDKIISLIKGKKGNKQ